MFCRRKFVKCLLSCSFLLLIAGCRRSGPPGIEDMIGHTDLTIFKLDSLRGTRDGDRLVTQALFTDSASILTIDMSFTIGTPATTLQSGTWQWTRNSHLETGTVAASSITFLGGQNGPPSIGGTFDLLGQDGAVRYRVRIPVTQLKTRLARKPDLSQ
jgi:hypothetical protein